MDNFLEKSAFGCENALFLRKHYPKSRIANANSGIRNLTLEIRNRECGIRHRESGILGDGALSQVESQNRLRTRSSCI